MDEQTGAPAVLRLDAGALKRNLILLCAGLEILFFTLDFQLNYADASGVGAVRRLFNTASEDSLPSWFAIAQTALVALTAWLIYAVVRSGASRARRAGWLTLAVLFTYLAFDDAATIHERLGTAFDGIFSRSAHAGSLAAQALAVFPSYRWQIVFVPVLAAFGLFMLVFLVRELRGRTARIIVPVALALLAVAVTLDFFEGLEPDHALNPYTAIAETRHLDYWAAGTFGESSYDTLVHFSKSAEECIEMFAMSLLWAVLVGHLGWVARDLRVVLAGEPGEALPVTTPAPAPAPRRAAGAAATIPRHGGDPTPARRAARSPGRRKARACS